MIIVQEDNNPVEDLLIETKLSNAFNLIETAASGFSVDTDELRVYCNETVNLINSFLKKLGEIEKNVKKMDSKQRFLQMINKGE